MAVSKVCILTGQYESDESKDPVAAEPGDDACEGDLSTERLDMLHHLWLRLSGVDHNHLLLLFMLLRWRLAVGR